MNAVKRGNSWGSIEQLTCAVVITALALGQLVSVARAEGVEPIVMKKVESALLDEDWQRLADVLLKKVDDNPEESSDPVHRLIKGHACLALNRNNKAMYLFMSVMNVEDLGKCETWCNTFFANHRTAVVAYLMKGDILARYQKWKEAVDCFSAVLPDEATLQPNSTPLSVRKQRHPLVFNARGIVHLRLDEFDHAISDFSAAAKTSHGRLADAYANLGAYQMQKRADAEMGIKCFTKALDLSDHFAFAAYGRACLRLIRGPLPTEDKEDFKEAVKEDLETALTHARCATSLLLADLPLIGENEAEDGVAVSDKPGSAFARDIESAFIPFAADRLIPFQHTARIRQIARDNLLLDPSDRKAAWDYNDALYGNYPRYQEFKTAVRRVHGGRFKESEIKVRTKIDLWGASRTSEVSLRRAPALESQRKAGRDTFGSDPGGISVSFEGSMEDLGNWPFRPQFTVVYGSLRNCSAIES